MSEVSDPAELDDRDRSRRVALVTGSTRGLGFEIARRLLRAGSRVALNYANDEAVALSKLDELRSDGFGENDVELFRGDVTDEQSVTGLVTAIEAKWHAIDILVFNATPNQPVRPIEEYSLAEYQTMYDFFVISPFLLTRATVGAMKSRKWGRIINIGSEVFQLGTPAYSAYVAAKGGQVGWTRSVSQELAPHGITVNLVAPGWIPVERHRSFPAEQKRRYHDSIPLGRWGTPADIADAVAYFASEEAGFVTGQTLCVNGGKSPW